nr:50S ribosomal protein L19e [Nitrososphaeria archaeon]
MSLKSQKRLAAEILKIGKSRVWIDPEQVDRIETAITREEIKRLIHEEIIKEQPEHGVSRIRVRSRSRRRGQGSRRGPTIKRKTLWINR